ncbi:hypothetical protein PG997_007545 [Apiospora hydei]|uniref:BZIP domain-containing protein n=1 Tax=Apiospora hydei TaxID=1337664 RepID=A0ABR1W8B8_9PEZI
MRTTAEATEKPRPKRKPPVRRDPERRRQQNLEAQKRYREKLRQRLGNLEAIAASVSQKHEVEEIGAAPTIPTLKVTPTDNAPVTDSLSSGTSSHVASETLSITDESEVSASVSPAAVYPEPPEESQWMVLQPYEATGSWDSIVHLDPSLLVCHRYCDGDTGLAWMPASGCGCSSPDDGLQPVIRHRGGAQSFSAAAAAGDPYANHLRLETVCTLDALFSLGTLLGIPSERMCPRETPSPFFRSGMNEYSADAIDTVQKIFRTLKPDLRPGREQVTVAHHPFIDCLPFPTLRRNLLLHRAGVDAEQLQFDVIEGLVCWGGAGVSRRDSRDSTGRASTGTPWDVRSWEAKECFLRKYWTMLGGEEGELVRQSEWWRGIRGEEPLRIELIS